MRYKLVPRKLLEQAKQLVQLRLFSKHDIGLRRDLSFKDLRIILEALKWPKKRLNSDNPVR